MLKACPHCSAGSRLVVNNPIFGVSGAYVECLNCGARTKTYSIHELVTTKNSLSTPITRQSLTKGIELAIKSWNKRTD